MEMGRSPCQENGQPLDNSNHAMDVTRSSAQSWSPENEMAERSRHHWFQSAQNRQLWTTLGKTYVQQRTYEGWERRWRKIIGNHTKRQFCYSYWQAFWKLESKPSYRQSTKICHKLRGDYCSPNVLKIRLRYSYCNHLVIGKKFGYSDRKQWFWRFSYSVKLKTRNHFVQLKVNRSWCTQLQYTKSCSCLLLVINSLNCSFWHHFHSLGTRSST